MENSMCNFCENSATGEMYINTADNIFPPRYEDGDDDELAYCSKHAPDNWPVSLGGDFVKDKEGRGWFRCYHGETGKFCYKYVELEDSRPLLDIIKKCAEIPSFSSYENSIHPFIENFIDEIKIKATIKKIPDNNLIIQVPGNEELAPIALTAHLDKINHFERIDIHSLEITETSTHLIGQLDDAVGVGMCLYLMKKYIYRFPPLYVLFSEMEESFGLENHSHLLRDNGNGLYPRIGATRIANYLLDNCQLPSLVLTIDTTPLFKREPGIAIYANHWDRNGVEPSDNLVNRTKKVVDFFKHINPNIRLTNNTNDYVTYGEIFNANHIPSLAIEPSIFPYHTKGEKVFISDIEKLYECIKLFLSEYSLHIQENN